MAATASSFVAKIKAIWGAVQEDAPELKDKATAIEHIWEKLHQIPPNELAQYMAEIGHDKQVRDYMTQTLCDAIAADKTGRVLKTLLEKHADHVLAEQMAEIGYSSQLRSFIAQGLLNKAIEGKMFAMWHLLEDTHHHAAQPSSPLKGISRTPPSTPVTAASTTAEPQEPAGDDEYTSDEGEYTDDEDAADEDQKLADAAAEAKDAAEAADKAAKDKLAAKATAVKATATKDKKKVAPAAPLKATQAASAAAAASQEPSSTARRLVFDDKSDKGFDPTASTAEADEAAEIAASIAKMKAWRTRLYDAAALTYAERAAMASVPDEQLKATIDKLKADKAAKLAAKKKAAEDHAAKIAAGIRADEAAKIKGQADPRQRPAAIVVSSASRPAYIPRAQDLDDLDDPWYAPPMLRLADSAVIKTRTTKDRDGKFISVERVKTSASLPFLALGQFIFPQKDDSFLWQGEEIDGITYPREWYEELRETDEFVEIEVFDKATGTKVPKKVPARVNVALCGPDSYTYRIDRDMEKNHDIASTCITVLADGRIAFHLRKEGKEGGKKVVTYEPLSIKQALWMLTPASRRAEKSMPAAPSH